MRQHYREKQERRESEYRRRKKEQESHPLPFAFLPCL
jgi:hypothetical protein